MTEHTYKGTRIRRCECERDRRWFIQAIHSPTGIPYSESECAHTMTLSEAKVLLDDFTRVELTTWPADSHSEA